MCSSDLSFQEETSPFNNVNLPFEEPKFISEVSIDLKKEDISQFTILQVKDDDTSKPHTDNTVLKAEVLETHNLLDMESRKEENLHLFFVDPLEKCVEVPTSSNYQAWILCKSQRHENLSPSVIVLVLKTNLQIILWIPLTNGQSFFFFFTLVNWLHWHFCII